MSDQVHSDVPLDNDGQGPKQRPRNFYRRRPGLIVYIWLLLILIFVYNTIGSERQNQDLGEDENHASNDDESPKSNNSDEQNNNGRGLFSRNSFQ